MANTATVASLIHPRAGRNGTPFESVPVQLRGNGFGLHARPLDVFKNGKVDEGSQRGIVSISV